MTQATVPADFRVASYNIRKARGLDRRRDPRRILAVLNTIGADVVALQEADFRLGNRPAALDPDLIAEETDFRIAPVARNDVSLGWHGNAVLVRDGVEVQNVRHVEIPALEPRGAVSVDLAMGPGLTVIATHLGLTRYHRRRQARRLRAQVDPARATVLLGDFNEWSQRRGLEPLADHFDIHAPGRSFHASRPVAALDRIALSPGLNLSGGGVLDDMRARRASDHLPIWADIRFAAA